jgi:leucyl-tRNA synthetase
VAEFGADALRLYEMFMGPLEEMKAWNTQSIIGLKRFLEKVWKLQSKVKTQDAKNNKIQSVLHKTVKKVSNDVENFRFNTAISSIMILVNEMDKQDELLRSDYCMLLVVLAPFAPHIIEEIWSNLGHEESIFLQAWPIYDEKLMQEDEVEIVVQVNGRVRERLIVAADVTEDEVRETALENAKVKIFTDGKEIKKIIFVPGKIINIVVE